MLNKSGVSVSLGDHLPISLFPYSLYSPTAVLPPVCTLLPGCALFDLGSLSVVYLDCKARYIMLLEANKHYTYNSIHIATTPLVSTVDPFFSQFLH